MIDADAARARARQGTPFSNSTEYELWSAQWCARCARDAFADYGSGCPLITIALLGSTPAEWIEPPPAEVWTPTGLSARNLYHCAEFRPRGGGDPEPRPKPEPDQDGLFNRPRRATRMLLPEVNPWNSTDETRDRHPTRTGWTRSPSSASSGGGNRSGGSSPAPRSPRRSAFSGHTASARTSSVSASE